jgi:hypothetical protein
MTANLHEISPWDYLEAYNHGLSNRPAHEPATSGVNVLSTDDTIVSSNTGSQHDDVNQ